MKTIFDQKDIDQNHTLAALSYLWILSVIILLIKNDSAYVQFHAKQGTVLFGLSVIFSLLPPLWMVNFLVWIVAVVALIRAYQGQTWEIPVVKDLAKKIQL